MQQLGIIDFSLRLFMGMLMGAAIGLERHWRQRSAGLRTNSLVSLGATAFILISIEIGGDAQGRIASYIVSGIGFLGAGVIMKDGLNVQGLNTAATIWCSAAVGALCGLGLYPQALMLSISIMLAHILLRPIGLKLSQINFIPSPLVQTDYQLKIRCHTEIENHVRVLLIQMLGNDDKLLLQSLISDDLEEGQQVAISAIIKAVQQQDNQIERVASRLTMEEKVVKVSWEIIGTHND